MQSDTGAERHSTGDSIQGSAHAPTPTPGRVGDRGRAAAEPGVAARPLDRTRILRKELGSVQGYGTVLIANRGVPIGAGPFRRAVSCTYRQWSVINLPSFDRPHDSGPIQWARGGSGAKAPPLAARPPSGLTMVRTDLPRPRSVNEVQPELRWRWAARHTPGLQIRARQTTTRSGATGGGWAVGTVVRSSGRAVAPAKAPPLAARPPSGLTMVRTDLPRPR